MIVRSTSPAIFSGADPDHRPRGGEHGVYLTGFVPNTIEVTPPLTVTPDEVDLTLEAFDAGLDEVERIYS